MTTKISIQKIEIDEQGVVNVYALIIRPIEKITINCTITGNN